MIGVWFHDREECRGDPAGTTVSKRSVLPAGDFLITKYFWPGGVSLWFVDDDEFTADERQTAYEAFLRTQMNEPRRCPLCNTPNFDLMSGVCWYCWNRGSSQS